MDEILRLHNESALKNFNPICHLYLQLYSYNYF